MATIDDLINERSDIHPQYLDKSDSARTVPECSPFDSQACYQRFDNEADDDEGTVNILKFKEQKRVASEIVSVQNENSSCTVSEGRLPGFETLASPFGTTDPNSQA